MEDWKDGKVVEEAYPFFLVIQKLNFNIKTCLRWQP